MVMLIVLAAFGAGLIGGAPIPMNKRKENVIEMHVELKESNESESEVLIFKKE